MKYRQRLPHTCNSVSGDFMLYRTRKFLILCSHTSPCSLSHLMWNHLLSASHWSALSQFLTPALATHLNAAGVPSSSSTSCSVLVFLLTFSGILAFVYHSVLSTSFTLLPPPISLIMKHLEVFYPQICTNVELFPPDKCLFAYTIPDSSSCDFCQCE